MKNVYLFSNIFPLYRKSIWEKLLLSDDFYFKFFYSKKYMGIEPVELDSNFNKIQIPRFILVKNIFIKKKLIWQTGVIKRSFDKVDSVVFLGESTNLSTWIASLIFKIRGVNVIFWGHGLYGNEGILKKIFRLIFYLLPHVNLVYEKRAKSLLIKNGFDQNKIHVIYNSINYDEQKKYFERYIKKSPESLFKNNSPTLLFIGRLTFNKKVELLIDAIIKLNKSKDFNLLIIGDGESRRNLEKKAKNLIQNGNCIFYGEAYDEHEISSLIFNSALTVSPGNIGLTAIHSLSYGTPVCSHSNFKNQMPEVEAIIEGENGFLFEENSLESLIYGIDKWFSENPKVDKKKIRRIIDQYYNPNFQYSIFQKILK